MDGGTQQLLKLNLGCGQNRREGYSNVDKEGEPDILCDLEQPYWPWPDSSVGEVLLVHVLEHIGQAPSVFLQFMRELYRVCANGAKVIIAVPHPRHDHFLGDPTHVRAITPDVIALFSKRNCERWKAIGAANTPLALYCNVDFEVRESRMILDERYAVDFDKGLIPATQLTRLASERNNVIKEIRMVLEVIKDRA